MSPTTNPRSAIVTGSGVIGMACAYFLMKAGWQVTLLERGELGRGSSHANCGLVCPSHVLPLPCGRHRHHITGRAARTTSARP